MNTNNNFSKILLWSFVVSFIVTLPNNFFTFLQYEEGTSELFKTTVILLQSVAVWLLVFCLTEHKIASMLSTTFAIALYFIMREIPEEKVDYFWYHILPGLLPYALFVLLSKHKNWINILFWVCLCHSVTSSGREISYMIGDTHSVFAKVYSSIIIFSQYFVVACVIDYVFNKKQNIKYNLLDLRYVPTDFEFIVTLISVKVFLFTVILQFFIVSRLFFEVDPVFLLLIVPISRFAAIFVLMWYGRKVFIEYFLSRGKLVGVYTQWFYLVPIIGSLLIWLTPPMLSAEERPLYERLYAYEETQNDDKKNVIAAIIIMTQLLMFCIFMLFVGSTVTVLLPALIGVIIFFVFISHHRVVYYLAAFYFLTVMISILTSEKFYSILPIVHITSLYWIHSIFHFSAYKHDILPTEIEQSEKDYLEE